MIPSLIGFLVVRALTFGPRLWCRHDGFRLIFGAGLGIGLCSACSFLGLLSGFSGLILEALLALAAATAVVLRSKRAGCRFCEAPVTTGQHKVLFAVLAGALGLALLAGMSIFVTQTELSPHGGWDGVAIWNLRARFLYRAGDAWRNGFTETLGWSHPDYPLLLPAFIARTWKVSGAESQSIPIALAAFFTFGSVGLIAGSLSILRGVPQGLLAALALAATPVLYVQGANQCGDVPVAFFTLATLAAMALSDRFDDAGMAVLAGAAAALNGWTKNEGLLWFLAFLMARVIVSRFRLLPAFLAGAAPVLAVILIFKARVATASGIFGAAGRAGMLGRLLDPTRYALIAREAIKGAWEFGPLLLSPFLILAIYLAVAGIRIQRQDQRALQTGILALLLTAIGYFFIYVLAPYELAWELRSSLTRLTLQLWPGIVFVIFLAARSPERVPAEARMPEPSERLAALSSVD